MAATIGDPDSTRTVLAIVALLVVMGIALVMLAFWLRRQTRPDPELLGPLELMGERSWRGGDPVWQRRRLDEVRPAEAVPLQWTAAPPNIDESFDAGPTATGFDDLHHEPRLDEPDEATGTDDDIAEETPESDNDTFTPIATARPLDDFSDLHVAPDAIERAMAELDAELGQPDSPSGS